MLHTSGLELVDRNSSSLSSREFINRFSTLLINNSLKYYRYFSRNKHHWWKDVLSSVHVISEQTLPVRTPPCTATRTTQSYTTKEEICGTEDDLGLFLLSCPPGGLIVQTTLNNTSTNLGTGIYVKCQYMSAVVPLKVGEKITCFRN